MQIEKREVRPQDLLEITSAFADRIASYKAKNVWNPHNTLPLDWHNGMVCCDLETGALFTQMPTHPTAISNEKSVVLLDGGLALIQRHAFPNYAIQFVSPNLWPRLEYLVAFAAESLRISGNWMLPSLEGAKIYTEASALKL